MHEPNSFLMNELIFIVVILLVAVATITVTVNGIVFFIFEMRSQYHCLLFSRILLAILWIALHALNNTDSLDSILNFKF